MGVQVVPAIAFSVKRAKESSMGLPKRAGLQPPGIYRSVYAGIIAGVSHINHQLASVQFRILIADDATQFQVSGRHTDEESSLCWHFNRDLKAVSRATANRQGCATGRAF